MKKFKNTIHCHIIIFFCIFSSHTFAAKKTYKASLALMPPAVDSNGKGVLIDFINLWSNMTGNQINIEIFPFKRSLRNVINQQVDFHVPLIRNPHLSDKKLSFDYSTSVIYKVNFVLYSNKSINLDQSKLSEYNILSGAAHADLFDFQVSNNFSSVESSLKMLNQGLIDGYIYAESDVDPVLKKMGYKNINRELYRKFDVHAVLPKGKKGQEADNMISDAITKIKADGRWDHLLDPLYVNWQP